MHEADFYLGGQGWHYLIDGITSPPFPSRQMAVEAYLAIYRSEPKMNSDTQTTPTPKKPWYTSKTLIVNALAAGLTALEASTGLLKPLVGENFYLIMAGILPVVNAVLRVVTTQPLSKSAQSSEVEGLS